VNDPLILAGLSFQSRLLVGTARYPNVETVQRAVAASGAEIVTVAMGRQRSGLLDILGEKSYHYLPNTSGCFTTKEAIFTAELAREALQTNWIKLEVIGDERTLYPNGIELLRAAEELVKRGFDIFPYCFDDPVLCCQLEGVGCAALMPLASPIGSGMGICNPHNLEIICAQAKIPVIVDAGIGSPSDLVQALELGADAVLLNTAIAQARDPVQMASAMRHAAVAGRLGRLAGRMPCFRH
jgi:thiazole synthase